MGRRSKRPKPRFYLGGTKKTIRPITMVYHYGLGKPLQYSTGEMISHKLWDQKNQRIKGSKNQKENEQITKYLERLKANAIEVFEEFGIISIPDFRKQIDYKMGFLQRLELQETKKLTLLEFVPKWIAKRKTDAQTKDKTGTNKNLGVWYDNLSDYCKHIGHEIDFDDIDWNWLQSFTNYCFSEKNHSQNNVQKGINYIKQFVNAGRKAGHTENRIVTERGFNIKKTATTKVVFYMDDIEKLYKFDCSKDDRLQKVKDLNIIGALTGMRYNMWGKIEKGLRKEIKGEYFIEVFTTKTKAQIAVPLDPMLSETLQRLNWQAPKMSRQRFSDYSKELWELVGITERVEDIDTKGGKMKITLKPKYELFHPHCLRRSFASNFFLMGIPAAWLMQITGHSTEKQFFQYINIEKRLTATYVSRYMKQLSKMKDVKQELKAI